MAAAVVKARAIGDRELTAGPGLTQPASPRWSRPSGWRTYERTTEIGSGAEQWAAATAAVMTWQVKTRSGFAVLAAQHPGATDERAAEGSRWWLSTHALGLRIREPVEVVGVVEGPERVGFAYGTLDGHPVTGEEAFVVHRDGDRVFFTLRSVTGAGQGWWRVLFPAVLVAQRLFRRRYLRSLGPDAL